MDGFRTLFYKEMLRFWKVGFQTVAAPVMTALMYLLIFSHALNGRVEVFEGVSYTSFLIPGLVMMSVLQNAFANTLVVHDPEQDHRQHRVRAAAADPAADDVRRLRAGLGGARPGGRAGRLPGDGRLLRDALRVPALGVAFALLGSAMLGTLGLIGGIWADKFDEIAAFQNFLIMPLTFLSGRLLFGPQPAAVLAGGCRT